MKLYPLLILTAVGIFSSCKSKEALVKYQPIIAPQETPSIFNSEPLTFEIGQPQLLAIDSTRIDVQNILPNYTYRGKQTTDYIQNSIAPLSADILNKAFQYKGVRYRRGGTSNAGMDCSGLVFTCYSAKGIVLPRSSASMANAVVDIPRKKAKKGDLIFFKTNRKRNQINHVGLVVEVSGEEIKFIHASIKKGVIVSSTKEAYYSRSYAKVGRVVNT